MYKQTLLLAFCLFGIFTIHGQNLFNAFDGGKIKMDKTKNKKAINDFHKQNTGKILFTYERIPFKTENVDIVSQYTFGKELFAREYWSKTMADAFYESFGKKANANTAIIYTVDIKGIGIYEQIFYGWSGNPEMETWYTNWFIAANPGTAFEKVFSTNLVSQALSKYKRQIKNTVSLKISSYIYDAASNKKGEMLATGDLNIDIANPSIIPNYTLSDYPACMPDPKMKDKSLEQTFVKVMNNQGWKEQFKIAVIHTEDYTIYRNKLTSIIEKRSLGASVASIKPDGTCMYQRFTFSQDHDGSTFSGNWRQDGIGEQFPIPCSCVGY